MAKTTKFSTNELENIIHIFFKDKKQLEMKLNGSNLARYAVDELGYDKEEIKYYHFTRNDQIDSIIKEYNSSKKERRIDELRDNSYFTSIDVKEFVKNNVNNNQKLTFFMTQIVEAQKNLYDRTLEAEYKTKKLEKENKTLSLKNQEYIRKNKELRELNNNLREQVNILNKALQIKDENQLKSALQSTKVVAEKYIHINKEVAVTEESIKKLDDSNGKDLDKFLNNFVDVFK